MTGILIPLVNLLVAMGASTFSAYISIIAISTFVGAIIGFWADPNSTNGAKFCAIIGLVLSVALVLAEVFP
jgi:uncharacterized phage infection (PIP) family protein YhgE